MSDESGSVTGLVVELSDLPALRSCLREARQRLGHIDIVVNNAGIHPKRNGGKYLVEEIESTQWHEVMNVNLTAPFVICAALLPAMKERGWGRVINIGSSGARNRPISPSAHYVASKAGLEGLTRCIAEEGAGNGITANCVAPGPVITRLTTSSSKEAIEGLTRSIPVGRYGTAEEIAALVEFLASDEASFITGAVIDANGGLTMN
ncbi:acetoacetyl-CoA reductase [Caballeronia novacaledonica]|uniref:Acetoacetyl-CoA reductase n=2 Tax=Caballeronia novacaledonica TaxID=1544861 RepID=A0AA37MT37_9BURK|nr:acetoacetyl-CoA reductase [Caballeronia novacaledonica]